jgi:glucokinase
VKPPRGAAAAARPEPSRTIGIDVGGTKLLGVVGVDGPEARRATPRGGGPKIVDAIVDVVDELGGADAVGIGVAGLVDTTGTLRVGPNLPGVIDFPFRDEVAARLGVPVAVDNDATTATWAELCIGAAHGATEVVCVTLGTGIGGGHVSGGVLQRGANGFAGEPGHMVVDPRGPACPCGRRGCWERFASGSGLGRLARDAASAGRAWRVVDLAGGDPEAVRGEHVTLAALEGDRGALAVLREFGWWVALGIANLVNVLDPAVVVVGGGLAEAGELLVSPVRERFAELVLAPTHRPPVKIVAAALGERAGAIGAGLLAEELIRS